MYLKVLSQSPARFIILIWIMVGFASLFTNFVMLKIYFKKKTVFLLAIICKFHIHHSLTWCGSKSLYKISLYFKKKLADNKWWVDPRLTFDKGYVTTKWTNVQLQMTNKNPKTHKYFKRSGIVAATDQLRYGQLIFNVCNQWFMVNVHHFTLVNFTMWL